MGTGPIKRRPVLALARCVPIGQGSVQRGIWLRTLLCFSCLAAVSIATAVAAGARRARRCFAREERPGDCRWVFAEAIVDRSAIV